MIRQRNLVAGVAALALSAALTACDSSKDLINPPPPVDSRFASYVALGNSITAGYQGGGITEATQKQSYAYLLAKAMGTRFAIPALRDPGCPPPVINIQTGARFGGTTAADSTLCALRNPASITDVLNNVAVPGATSLDPTSSSTSASNPLTTFILGGKTQVQRAKQANPTFASIWIGNNDVLPAAVSGFIVPAAGVSPGLTPTATFNQNYDNMLNALGAGTAVPSGVLIGVVDAKNAPVLFKASSFNDATFKALFDAYAGTTVNVLPNCADNPDVLISFAIVKQIRLFTADPTSPKAHPPVISCVKNQPAAPVGDLFVLDVAEQQAVSAAVTAYNQHIQQKATQLGWAYWDPNTALDQLRAAAAIPAHPLLDQPTAPFGPYLSTDGAHPSAQTHVLIANSLIDVINAQYKTSIPKVQ